jgi:hypothetical protein
LAMDNSDEKEVKGEHANAKENHAQLTEAR